MSVWNDDTDELVSQSWLYGSSWYYEPPDVTNFPNITSEFVCYQPSEAIASFPADVVRQRLRRKQPPLEPLAKRFRTREPETSTKPASKRASGASSDAPLKRRQRDSHEHKDNRQGTSPFSSESPPDASVGPSASSAADS